MEYATMEMTKSEQIRIGLQKSFQSGKSAKVSTPVTATVLVRPVNSRLIQQKLKFSLSSLSDFPKATV